MELFGSADEVYYYIDSYKRPNLCKILKGWNPEIKTKHYELHKSTFFKTIIDVVDKYSEDKHHVYYTGLEFMISDSGCYIQISDVDGNTRDLIKTTIDPRPFAEKKQWFHDILKYKW